MRFKMIDPSIFSIFIYFYRLFYFFVPILLIFNSSKIIFFQFTFKTWVHFIIYFVFESIDRLKMFCLKIAYKN